MADLAYGDIVQQYHKNLVLYKGAPVRVEAVDRDCNVTIFHVATQDLEVVKFNLKDFKAHTTRLGMMNVHKTVVYVTRIPVRKMQIGLNMENINVGFLDFKYKIGQGLISDTIRGCGVKEFADLLAGTNPTFSKAIEIAEANKDACAFDRQFAVSHDGLVFYKTQLVGSFKEKNSPSDIVFLSAHQHLSVLLENNHEKTVGIACTA